MFSSRGSAFRTAQANTRRGKNEKDEEEWRKEKRSGTERTAASLE